MAGPNGVTPEKENFIDRKFDELAANARGNARATEEQEAINRGLMKLSTDLDTLAVLKELCIQSNAFNPLSAFNAQVYYQNGKRDIVLWLLQEIRRVNPNGFVRVLTETLNEADNNV